MRWSNRIEMIYRVFLRQFEDVEGRFVELEGRLSETSMGEEDIIEYSPPHDHYWPIAPEDTESVEDRKLLTVLMKSRPHVVVREVIVTIPYTDDLLENEADCIIDEVRDAVGLDTFVSVRVIREILSGKQAV